MGTGQLAPAHSRCLQATGSWDSAICIWDLRMGTPVISHQKLEGHSGNVSCLCYSASGLLVSWVALGSRLAPCWLQTHGLRAVCCPGFWLLGQDHPHLEAFHQKLACSAQGPCHLGEEHSFLP